MPATKNDRMRNRALLALPHAKLKPWGVAASFLDKHYNHEAEETENIFLINNNNIIRGLISIIPSLCVLLGSKQISSEGAAKTETRKMKNRHETETRGEGNKIL